MDLTTLEQISKIVESFSVAIVSIAGAIKIFYELRNRR